MRPETMAAPLAQVETTCDRNTDRWQDFRGVGIAQGEEYVFDEDLFRWKPVRV